MNLIFIFLFLVVIIYIILLLVILFSNLFLYQVFPDQKINGCRGQNCVSKDCVGYRCQTINCTGSGCIAGDCYGEDCQAGGCIGSNCKAGDCFGLNCKPGVCIDPNCPEKTCLQINKKCTDGKAHEIRKNYILKLRDIFPKRSVFNVPFCDDIKVYDIRNGKLENLGIKNVQILNKGTLEYSNVYYSNNDTSFKIDGKTIKINDDDLVTATDPATFKDINCNICKKGSCNVYTPNISIENNSKKWNWIV